jgi:nitrogen fixation/metabolism regulation signal transduction histidine kinase
VRLIANPVLFRAALVLVCSVSAFVLGLFMMRRLRRNIAAESDLGDGANASLGMMPAHLYSTVIQQLKQQKHELQVQTQSEQLRARTSESLSHAVLANLSCGVLVFGNNGLVKTANPAAKAILGFASMTGMNAEDIFRGSAVHSPTAGKEVFPDETFDTSVRIADEVQTVLHENSKRRDIKADYQGPSGQKRTIQVTVSRIPAVDGGLLGVACLINDLSELEDIRRKQELRGEISAEMALQLRSSLTTIAGFAQQLANNRDPEFAQDLAKDIAQEAAQLDRTIGGFLTAERASAHAAK